MIKPNAGHLARLEAIAGMTWLSALWLIRSLSDAHVRQPVAMVGMRCDHVAHREPRAAEHVLHLVGLVAGKETPNARHIALLQALSMAFLQANDQHAASLQHAADFSQRVCCRTLGY